MLPPQQVQNLPTLGHLHYFHIIGVTILSHCEGPLTDSLFLPLTDTVYSNTAASDSYNTEATSCCYPAQKPAVAPHSMQGKRSYKVPRDLPPTSLLSPPPSRLCPHQHCPLPASEAPAHSCSEPFSRYLLVCSLTPFTSLLNCHFLTGASSDYPS